MMKRVIVVAAALLLIGSAASAQYTMTLKNDTLNAPNYEFDVWIASTAGTINLTSYQIVLSYNTAIAGAGSLTFSYLTGTSGLTNPPSLGVAVYPNDGGAGVPHLIAGSNAGTDNVTTTPVRVGRFRIANSVRFAVNTASVAWVFGSANSAAGGTLIEVNNADVTNAANHGSTLTNSPLPIQLATFNAAPNMNGSGVRLTWATASETNNYGFYIQRRLAVGADFADLPGSFVPGHGTTIARQQYSYVDAPPQSPLLEYRIRQVDLDGTVHISDAVSAIAVAANDVAPAVFALSQNYPNPFNPATEIQFTVETTGHASLKIYNVIGQVVATLFDGLAESGHYYRMTLDGSRLSSGVYLYRLQGVNKSELKKMVLLK